MLLLLYVDLLRLHRLLLNLHRLGLLWLLLLLSWLFVHIERQRYAVVLGFSDLNKDQDGLSCYTKYHCEKS